jgi:hypothetical protein
LVCSGGGEHRTYYDGTHARYQRGLRSGEPAELRAAHDEAVWYRANELEWVDADRTVAITKCEAVESGQPSWTPDSRPLDWSTLRMMSGQGSLDDYLVTGDPAAKQALAGFGKAYLRTSRSWSRGRSRSPSATSAGRSWVSSPASWTGGS